ncbi:hypothetical protein F441_21738 [Phytophthora nicotianae CJ01A1]|uniref:Uncharacterized protein n=5 Tax=Phytophthora nicotianae TaxID=4792 RepID=W2QTI7_PHYN3|nr:hypothetical protein PPTG_21909 [Phytophthora nicotianae INRA-310]ETI31132.1 hypothetical protein F443_21856 [Phytophthora nicotianae P1569]ETO59847.1 hypothetical protein F444_21878 [Phytophthora nicotianae P1976]ETP00951.1 hypothetical protein F441_21738 [Phytophthora nicotianae CJ01A1]ETP29087.1 hypothetical protein F442_21716 [Phytophthora nicotianae P10297]ETN16408.1 hypothetical protein PPTG_21909 [Phytophthora nicotianae INRA-310]
MNDYGVVKHHDSEVSRKKAGSSLNLIPAAGCHRGDG